MSKMPRTPNQTVDRILAIIQLLLKGGFDPNAASLHLPGGNGLVSNIAWCVLEDPSDNRDDYPLAIVLADLSEGWQQKTLRYHHPGTDDAMDQNGVMAPPPLIMFPKDMHSTKHTCPTPPMSLSFV